MKLITLAEGFRKIANEEDDFAPPPTQGNAFLHRVRNATSLDELEELECICKKKLDAGEITPGAFKVLHRILMEQLEKML